MGKVVVMPKLGLTMTEGTVDEWKKNEGYAVKQGEVLFTVSTDKLTNDIEAPASGTLLKIVAKAGDPVPVLSPIAFIGEPGEKIDLPEASAPAAAPAAGAAPAAADRTTNWVNNLASPRLTLASTSSNGMYTG